MGEGLSAREREVLAAVLGHLSNAEIADRLVISVRTVESHVTSMLRKLGVTDRRALARLASERPELVDRGASPTHSASASSDPPGSAGGVPPVIDWPQPASSFVGRNGERASLDAALGTHRLVTAVGPGGVGKTRLALRVVADRLAAGRHPDGAWYVDLVPVTDERVVDRAVADALGLGEQPGRTPRETLVDRLRDRRALLLLDNCEHLLGGVTTLLETLLDRCPRLVVLATSRERLLLPAERVCPVPGLSVATGDAVELFRQRAVSAGVDEAELAGTEAGERIGRLCDRLDGMALAIELAAARLPGLGLDGLEAAIGRRLDLLSGGARADGRHRSLRATLAWSWELLDPAERRTLCAAARFAAPFTAVDAAALDVEADAGEGEAAGRDGVPTAVRLARLCDRSLLTTVATEGSGPRYRMLETIRQYADEQAASAGALPELRLRHAEWALSSGRRLREQVPPGGRPTGLGWRAGTDRVVDELRAAAAPGAGLVALGARGRTGPVLRLLGELLFLRGRPEAAQRRFEQAAASEPGTLAAGRALRAAAGAAETRHFGDEALRLFRAAAAALHDTGADREAAEAVARWGQLVGRGPGLITRPPAPEEVLAALTEAERWTPDDPALAAALLVARAYQQPQDDPATGQDADRARAGAEAAGDPVTACVALDLLMATELRRGRVVAAAATTERRAELLDGLEVRPENGLEFSDGFNMATDSAIGVGDLAAARRYAERVAGLPFYSENSHIAAGRLMVVTALAGDWQATSANAAAFREGWELAGRPTDGDQNRGVYAAMTVAALRGDTDAEETWRAVHDALLTPALADRDRRCEETFDALRLLDQGRPEEALAASTLTPEQLVGWHDGLWRPWHAALWAEASVLAGVADAADRLTRAGAVAVGNRIAEALVRRATAFAAGDPSAVAREAPVLSAAGCPYQAARSRRLAERLA
ncbi:ATP-binding protein [Microlunatus kandeliicorticis]|uniref:ATP-binding protein n=1 Tax=Microlunatus kandeliicorticis TaxID=1759536 RepID=UPI0015FC5E31|nr:LuxR C-terminal-related transcriptional regulator [Microlunatus kandeliicorticis]